MNTRGTILGRWLPLFRPPNLLTVPGDPVAGFLLAGGVQSGSASLRGAALASLLLYSAGLLLNDWADAAEDARERPERPIPSGRVSRGAVLVAALLLAAASLGACAFAGARVLIGGTVLLALIVAYDLFLKRTAVIGPLAMGACRGASLMLGALAASAMPFRLPVLLAAAVSIVYVALVTNLARRETQEGTARKVGVLLSAILFLQAAFCAAAGTLAGLVWAAVWLALWPLNRIMSRRFYAS